MSLPSERSLRDFLAARAESGSVALLFALSAAALFGAVGAGVDLARTYTAKQKLSEVATLACQYASRPSVVQTASPTYSGQNGGTTYQSNVTNYITSALQNQQFSYTQKNSAPFTYMTNGPANVNIAADVPTTIMKVFRINQLSVSATSHCYDNPGTIAQTVPDAPGQNLIEESFETTGCGGTCAYYYQPNGTGVGSPPGGVTNSFTSTPAYTGGGGRKWYVIGTCLEVDSIGTIESTVPDGSHSVELDCNGNSSMSTKAYVPAGSYELRYFYKARVSYPDYSPAYVCGSTASDVGWANNTRAVGGPFATALRTNQINAYFDLDQNGQPPTHVTMDNTQTLAGQSLVDMCVYSAEWIERSVRINVSTPGFYWLSFAADGLSDTFGGQIDNVRLCQQTCAGSPRDNFPSAWLAANNGGQNKELFRDGFEAPVYTRDAYCGVQCTTSANMNLSLGTSGTSQSGWPAQTASGWATSPYNEMDVYFTGNAASGNQFLELDASATRGLPNSNRTLSRPFLLDPGYYQVTYAYRSNAFFVGAPSPQCTAAPSRSTDLATYAGGGGANATFMGSNWGYTNYDSNTVAVFMASDQVVSAPVGGGALDSATRWTNPDGSNTASPTVSPTAVNLTNYNPAQANPVLDICRYANTWQTRTVAVLIQKPGYHWLHMAALGTGDNIGGTIDDVRITALGSPAMSNPPSPAVTIPVANPQPGSTLALSGYSIVADPLIPPAPAL